MLSFVLKFNFRLASGTFDKMPYQKLATPQHMRQMMKIPHFSLGRQEAANIYQGKSYSTKQQTCFSEKKSNRRVSPNIFYKALHSKVLGCRVKAHVSSTAYRTMKKYGGFDNYIACMDPKKLQSPYAEYLQTLIHRKIQNPDMLVPYVLKSKQLKKIRSRDYVYRKIPKIIMPRNSDPYHNYRPFGQRIQEMDDEQYQKHLELEKLSQAHEDIDNTHPLIKQLHAKLQAEKDPAMEKLAQQSLQAYLNPKRDKKWRKKVYLQELKDIEQSNQRMREESFKKGGLKTEELDQEEENRRFAEYQDRLEKSKQQAVQSDERDRKKMSKLQPKQTQSKPSKKKGRKET